MNNYRNTCLKRTLILTLLIILGLSVFAVSEDYEQKVKKNEKLLEQARESFSNEDYQATINILENIRDFFEKTSEAQDIYYLLAKSHYNSKNIESAYKYLKLYQNFFRYGKYTREVNELLRYIEDIREKFRSIELPVPDTEKLFAQMKELKERKMYDRAIYLLKKIIRISPDNPIYHYELAVLYNRKHKITAYNENVDYLSRELQEYQKITQNIVSPEVYYNIAFLYYQMRHFEKAREYFNKVIELSPDSIIGKVAQAYIEK